MKKLTITKKTSHQDVQDWYLENVGILYKDWKSRKMRWWEFEEKKIKLQNLTLKYYQKVDDINK